MDLLPSECSFPRGKAAVQTAPSEPSPIGRWPISCHQTRACCLSATSPCCLHLRFCSHLKPVPFNFPLSFFYHKILPFCFTFPSNLQRAGQVMPGESLSLLISFGVNWGREMF